MLALIRSELQAHRRALLAELRAQGLRTDNEPVVVSPPSAPRWRPTVTTEFGKQLAAATIATSFAAAFLFGAVYIYTARSQSETPQFSQSAIAPEIAEIQQDRGASPALPRIAANTEESDLAVQNRVWVRHYAFGAIPLDDARAREYEVLLADVKNEGFAGTVKLEVFEGRFCLNLTPDGSYELAPLNQPAMSCDRIGTPTETVSITQQSVAFSNMMAVAGRDGQLRIETAFHGPMLPIVDYPALDYAVTAGEWNAAAAYNQRVVLHLARDEVDARNSRIADYGNRGKVDRLVADLVR